jgi:hypothetical protein
MKNILCEGFKVNPYGNKGSGKNNFEEQYSWRGKKEQK